ncbi:hypothetical protein EV580_1340 [Mycobacterium sp. BK086]|uniref:hypothetical protein n=1 Tax=Mycobacterium sp. BK086 TaxID=2512165 RepID=UPI00106066EE|nr:hypothetical protein [Mycobacterium sp. BK086]TDO18157.1 hypothetical protein EV580_1340 [Mycobacterium sp. BK086]
MSFEARYAGDCAADSCNYGDGRIRPGDDVEYVDEELMHRECAKSVRRGDPPLCRECFTHHRGECA